MIVVTGATGLVGNVLLHSLAAEGKTELRALARRGSSTALLSDLDVEVVEGDVLGYDSLVRAFDGAQVVYHLAGTVSIASGGYKRLHGANVVGTRNVLAACREAGVGRLVYASSVHAFVRQPHGTCLTETAAIDPGRTHGAYDRTKAEATRLVLQAAHEGLDVVVVHPSGIIGPFDHRPSPIGAAIIACGRGGLGVYVHGAYNFVDVRDVAQGLMAAAARGRPGESYLLTGDEITVAELLQTVARLVGGRPPRLRVPLRLIKAVGPLIPFYYWVTREQPLFTSYSLRVISSNCRMSYEKAAREVGFSPRRIEESLEVAVRWFCEQGMI